MNKKEIELLERRERLLENMDNLGPYAWNIAWKRLMKENAEYLNSDKKGE